MDDQEKKFDGYNSFNCLAKVPVLFGIPMIVGVIGAIIIMINVLLFINTLNVIFAMIILFTAMTLMFVRFKTATNPLYIKQFSYLAISFLDRMKLLSNVTSYEVKRSLKDANQQKQKFFKNLRYVKSSAKSRLSD